MSFPLRVRLFLHLVPSGDASIVQAARYLPDTHSVAHKTPYNKIPALRAQRAMGVWGLTPIN